MFQVADKYIPDLKSRYFTTDFPFGLAILKQIAEFVNMETPSVNRIWEWKIAGSKKCFRYQNYGIYDYESFEIFYTQ